MRACSQVCRDTHIPVTPTNCCAYTPKVLQHVHIPLNTCEHSCVPLNTCKHSHVTLNTCKQACVLFIPLNTCSYPKNWKKCRIRACTTERQKTGEHARIPLNTCEQSHVSPKTGEHVRVPLDICIHLGITANRLAYLQTRARTTKDQLVNRRAYL